MEKPSAWCCSAATPSPRPARRPSPPRCWAGFRKARRCGAAAASAGELCAVIGNIGDGWLGLKAARGEIADPTGALAARFRLPEPRLDARAWLRAHVSAAADVSDGLIADAAHIAEASKLGLTLKLEELPLSAEAAAWLGAQPDEVAARIALATGGDDYAIVCALRPAGSGAGVARTPIVGTFRREPGVRVTFKGKAVEVARTGWRH